MAGHPAAREPSELSREAFRQAVVEARDAVGVSLEESVNFLESRASGGQRHQVIVALPVGRAEFQEVQGLLQGDA